MKVIFEPKEHRYFDENNREFPSVTTILKHFGMTPDYDRFGNEASRSFGSVVHRTLELFDNGVLDKYEYDPAIEPYLGQWIKFKKDYRIDNFKIIETPMCSETWSFAGTCDRYTDGIVVDLKTGIEQPAHSIQTAMYKILVEENLKVKVNKRVCVYLKGDSYKFVENRNKNDVSLAKSLMQIYGFKKINKLC
jgi:hypothetical protein